MLHGRGALPAGHLCATVRVVLTEPPLTAAEPTGFTSGYTSAQAVGGCLCGSSISQDRGAGKSAGASAGGRRRWY
jgi:hypothetical protein